MWLLSRPQIPSEPLAAVRLLGELFQQGWNRPWQGQSARSLDQHVHHRLHHLHVHRVSLIPETKVAAVGWLTLKSRPTITDRWGRKPCIIAGCCFMIVGCFVNTFSINYGSELCSMNKGM